MHIRCLYDVHANICKMFQCSNGFTSRTILRSWSKLWPVEIVVREEKGVRGVQEFPRARQSSKLCSRVHGLSAGHRTHDSVDGRVQPLDGAYDFQDEDDWERLPIVEAGRQAGQLSLKRGEKMPPRDCSLCCAFYFSEQFWRSTKIADLSESGVHRVSQTA